MKKLLLLGGSSQQVVAIETAKKLGYYTVLCDYLDDNPGQYCADKFYLVSTTDKDAVLEVAEKEKVDGVIAYASDPAAPTAAYVAEKLNLPGNPFNSVDTLCNKDKFRQFLKENGFNTPASAYYSDKDNIFDDFKERNFSFPVIIKPVDSSGSKGVSVIEKEEDLKSAVEFAFGFSRCKRIIIEDFIVKDHKYIIGGDIFIVDGEVKIWGLMNCYRDSKVNELVPVGKSYPVDIKNEYLLQAKKTLQSLVDKLEIKFGAMNVELVVDKKGEVYLIDIGPRNGGNMIPDLMCMIFDTDIVALSIKLAMGEMVNLPLLNSDKYYSTYNVHSSRNGILNEVKFSDKLEKYIIKKCIYKSRGDGVEFFDCAPKVLGIIFLKYNSQNEMMNIMEDIEKEIEVDLL